MVAESVKEPEVLTPEAEATPVPESEAPPADDDISEEAVTSFLKSEKIIEGTAEGDGAGASDDGDEPSLEGLTPKQILELGKQQGKSETQTEAQSQASAYQRQQRAEGARNAYLTAKARGMERAAQLGLDPSQVGQDYDILYGNFNLVYQHDMEQTYNQALKVFAESVPAYAGTVLGQSRGKALADEWNKIPEAERSTSKFLSLYADAARQGYLSPSDADKKVSGAIKAFIAKLPKDARDAIGFNPSSTKTTSAGSGVSRSDDEKLLDPSTPVSQLKEIMAKRAR